MSESNKLQISDSYIEEFFKQLKQDYRTARFKTEIVFDTLLLPDILVELVKKELNIETEYITKEFPIYNKRIYGESGDKKIDNKSIAVDYLIKSNDKFYLVELKTDDDSFKPEQRDRYQKLIEADLRFKNLFEDYWNIYYSEKYFCQAKEMLENLNSEHEISDKTDLYNRKDKRQAIINGLNIADEPLEIIYIVPDKKQCNLTNISVIELNKLEKTKYLDAVNVCEFINIWKYVVDDELDCKTVSNK